jgi:hypothetical protein
MGAALEIVGRYAQKAFHTGGYHTLRLAADVTSPLALLPVIENK